MRLFSRLVLLALVCLLPIMGAQAISQLNMYRQRQGQLDNLALRQAELANGELAGMVDGVRQFGLAVVQFPEVHNAGAACASRLATLQRSLHGISFPRGL